jgi:hypothetical protein
MDESREDGADGQCSLYVFLGSCVMIELTDWQLWVFMVCCSWIGIRRPGIRSPGRFKEYASVYVRGLWSVLTIYRFGTGSGE